jgi:hypothetical protein
MYRMNDLATFACSSVYASNCIFVRCKALCLLTFAVSLGGMWSAWGGGWVEFVAMSSFITTLIWFILHMLLTSLPNLLLSRPYVS